MAWNESWIIENEKIIPSHFIKTNIVNIKNPNSRIISTKTKNRTKDKIISSYCRCVENSDGLKCIEKILEQSCGARGALLQLKAKSGRVDAGPGIPWRLRARTKQRLQAKWRSPRQWIFAAKEENFKLWKDHFKTSKPGSRPY